MQDLLSGLLKKGLFAIVGIAIFFGYMKFKGGADAAMDGPSAAEQNRFAKLLEPFGQALMAGDFDAAYTFCSSAYQRKKPIETFKAEMQKAREEFGVPIRIQTEVGLTDADELAEYDEEYPDIPRNERLAFGLVEMALEVDETGEAERCYDCNVLIVNDQGVDKIGDIEFLWCD